MIDEIGNAGKYDFDFNTVERPLSDDISREADVYFRDALEAVERHGAGSRVAVIKNIEAMVVLTRDLVPKKSEALCGPVDALVAELKDLEAGRPPGRLTAPKRRWQRLLDSMATIQHQARAVVAFGWLKLIGLRPRAAAHKVAEVIRSEPLSLVEDTARKQARKEAERIEEWSRYFRRDQRRRQASAAIWHELECALWAYGGRSANEASEREVLDWLRPANRRK